MRVRHRVGHEAHRALLPRTSRTHHALAPAVRSGLSTVPAKGGTPA